MYRRGFVYPSDERYGDFGGPASKKNPTEQEKVRFGFTESGTYSGTNEPRQEFTQQPINPANRKMPVIKASETDDFPEVLPKPNPAYPGRPSPKERQQPPLLPWEKPPLRRSSLDPPLTPHPHPSPRQQIGNRRAPVRFPTPASDAGSELSTARNTRSKRKVAELDNDALEEFERKRRGRGTRDDPIAVDESTEKKAGGKTVKKVKGAKKEAKGGKKTKQEDEDDDEPLFLEQKAAKGKRGDK